MTEQTKCPILGCAATVKPGKLMCLMHWRELATELKRAVNSTWRAYKAARREGTPEEQLAAIGTYRVARDAAIEATNARETARG